MIDQKSVYEDQELSGVAIERAAEAADSQSGLAGRWPDAAVAERVMGWSRCPDLELDDYLNRRVYQNKRLGHHPIFASHLPCYSTEIAAAMEVVEKITETTDNALMKTLGFAVFTIHRYPDGRWRAQRHVRGYVVRPLGRNNPEGGVESIRLW